MLAPTPRRAADGALTAPVRFFFMSKVAAVLPDCVAAALVALVAVQCAVGPAAVFARDLIASLTPPPPPPPVVVPPVCELEAAHAALAGAHAATQPVLAAAH